MRTKTQKHKNNNKIIFDTHVHNTHTYMCIVNLIPFLEYNITCARYYEILYKQLIVVLVLQQMEGNNIFEILSKKAIEKRRVSVREMRGVSVREMRGDGRIKPRRHCDYVSECYTYFSLCCLQRCFVLFCFDNKSIYIYVIYHMMPMVFTVSLELHVWFIKNKSCLAFFVGMNSAYIFFVPSIFPFF